MNKNVNKAENNQERNKYLCNKCSRTFFSNESECPYCNSKDLYSTDTLYIFSDCFSYHNGKPDQMSGYTTIVTNERFDLEDSINIEYIERKAFNNTTNNFGELMGVLSGLAYFINNENHIAYKNVKVISDSEYVILGCRERMYKWRRNGWTNTSGKVKNLEIWKSLYEATMIIKEMNINLEFIHQKGHEGKNISKEDNPIIYLQEKCDTLSVELKNKIVKSREVK